MELLFGIVLLAMSFLLTLMLFIAQKENENVAPSSVSGALVMVLLIAGTALIDEYCNPRITPIDVYRGNTTLETTYRDSIAIDSVVVWKEEVK